MSGHQDFLDFIELCFADLAVEAQKTRVERLDQRIALDTIAYEHFGFLGLIYERGPLSLFSAPTRKKIEGSYKHNLYRNRLVLHRAIKLQTLLQGHLAHPMIFVGEASLVLTAYRTVGGRSTSTIDFWIADSDPLQTLLPLLQTEGYVIERLDEQHVEFKDALAFRYRLRSMPKTETTSIKYDSSTFHLLSPAMQRDWAIHEGEFAPHVPGQKQWVADVLLLEEKFCLNPIPLSFQDTTESHD